MTSEQRRELRTRLRIGRAFGTGGPSWTPVTASGAAPGTSPTISVGALITLYVLEAAMVRSSQALPQVGIYKADWWGVGAVDLAIAPDVILVSAADATLAFLVDGDADTSQGAPLFPLKKLPAPTIGIAPIKAMRTGLRIGF